MKTANRVLAHAATLVVKEFAKATHTRSIAKVHAKANEGQVDTKVMVNSLLHAAKDGTETVPETAFNRVYNMLIKRHFNVKVLGAGSTILHAKKRVRIDGHRYHALVLYNTASGALRVLTRS